MNVKKEHVREYNGALEERLNVMWYLCEHVKFEQGLEREKVGERNF